MGIYEPNHQIGMWEDSFKADSSQNTCASTIVETDTKLDYMAEVCGMCCLATLCHQSHQICYLDIRYILNLK